MFQKLLLKILTILIIPIFLFSDNIPETPIKLIGKDTSVTKPTIEPTIVTEDTTKNLENQIDIQNKLINEVILNINNESYLTSLPEKSFYENEILFLTNKINANNIQNNTLAAQRDELKVAYLDEKSYYENTLKDIIIGKQEFKNKKYFEEILQNNINKIQKFKLDPYTLIYNNELKNDSKVSTEFIDSYIELYNQKHTQLFVLQYLYANMQKIRASNFFIDEFNLKYIINKIDNIKSISYFSSLTSYHLNFSIGEASVVLLIIIFFRLLNRYLIALIINFISKILFKNDQEAEESVLYYLKEAINSPLIYSLYLFSIQISIFILIKDQSLINLIMLWINTIYMVFLFFFFYFFFIFVY